MSRSLDERKRAVSQFCIDYPLIKENYSFIRLYLENAISENIFLDNLRLFRPQMITEYSSQAASLLPWLDKLEHLFSQRLRGTLITGLRHKEKDGLLQFYRPPPKLTLSRTEQRNRILVNTTYLQMVVAPLVKRYSTTFSAVLGGNVRELSHAPDDSFYLDTKVIQKRYIFPKIKKQTFAFYYFTRRDLEWLDRNYPMGRYKFYLSCRITSKTAFDKSQLFLAELLKHSFDNRLSILTKKEDHNYDSCNIYTWDKEQMTLLLVHLYHKYQTIFNPVHHFFQEPLHNVSPLHIGCVQEPSPSVSIGSHSTRMSRLGMYLDKDLTYEKSCEKAGIKPEFPWELS